MASDSAEALNLRVASFSYYLDTHPEPETAAVSVRLPPPPFPKSTTTPQTHRSPDLFTSFRKDTTKHGREIGVFRAEKYFSMTLDFNHRTPLPEKVVPYFPAKTPSICSEATSQDPLFPHERHGKYNASEINFKPPSSSIWRRRIFPSCFSKKAVEIDKSDRGEFVAETGDSKTGEKLCVLTWNDDDDFVGSEASSDLFELENIAGSLCKSRSTLNMSPVTGNYPPSEASIQWSVATASAAELSECTEEKRRSFVGGEVRGRRGRERKRAMGEEERRGGGSGGGILSCRNRKAVEVA